MKGKYKQWYSVHSFTFSVIHDSSIVFRVGGRQQWLCGGGWCQGEFGRCWSWRRDLLGHFYFTSHTIHLIFLTLSPTCTFVYL